MPIDQYYLLTSNKKQKILATKNYLEAYEFIKKYHDTKVRKVNYKAAPRVVDKRMFLQSFLENTKDQNKFFDLSEIMITGETNQIPFLKSVHLLERFRKYQEVKQNNL
jgi:hypothetical protein